MRWAKSSIPGFYIIIIINPRRKRPLLAYTHIDKRKVAPRASISCYLLLFLFQLLFGRSSTSALDFFFLTPFAHGCSWRPRGLNTQALDARSFQLSSFNDVATQQRKELQKKKKIIINRNKEKQKKKGAQGEQKQQLGYAVRDLHKHKRQEKYTARVHV